MSAAVICGAADVGVSIPPASRIEPAYGLAKVVCVLESRVADISELRFGKEAIEKAG